MGNQVSQANSSNKDDDKIKTLPQVVDYIATNYILTQDFRDLEKLSDSHYCDKLVILTSKVIGQKLNAMEVEYLAQRMEQGVEMNKMTKDKVIYLNNKNMSKLDIRNPTAKRRRCIGIAKFYVKVAHLFAAIVSTINPEYSYINKDGQKERVGLLNKRKIPDNVETKLVKNGLCSKRINALINHRDFENINDKEDITISPNFCTMNQRSNGEIKYLKHETGIPELKQLYYDVYDYDQGGFKNMSEEMKTKYEEDVKRFYKAFTNSDDVPENIKNFSDINLREFHKSKGCQKNGEEKGIYTKSYTGSLKDKLFSQYASQVKTMMETANSSQDKLLGILDELFAFSFDKVENKKKVIINPSLNETGLQKLVDDARGIIVDLYINCENDFVDCLKTYEAIVEAQMLRTTQKQLDSLKEMSENYNTNYKPGPIPPNAPRNMNFYKPERHPEPKPRLEHKPAVEAPISSNAIINKVNANKPKNGNGNARKND